jgi:hypothetical protein
MRWERRIIGHAARTVYTSPLTTAIMGKRIGKRAEHRMVTITNGFSEMKGTPRRDVPTDKCLFCYVGNLMAGHRRPDLLFRGLQWASKDDRIAREIRVQFVGGMAGFEENITRYGLTDLVSCSGSVPQAESKRYMQGADVLVLIQGITGPGKDVISGKAYEYLSARKPILAVVPEEGGDAWLVRKTQSGIVTGIDSAERVADAIRRYWNLWRNGQLGKAVADVDIDEFSRRNLTRKLADLFDEVIENRVVVTKKK